jgi:hypothetical protein
VRAVVRASKIVHILQEKDAEIHMLREELLGETARAIDASPSTGVLDSCCVAELSTVSSTAPSEGESGDTVSYLPRSRL